MILRTVSSFTILCSGKTMQRRSEEISKTEVRNLQMNLAAVHEGWYVWIRTQVCSETSRSYIFLPMSLTRVHIHVQMFRVVACTFYQLLVVILVVSAHSRLCITTITLLGYMYQFRG